MKMKFRSENAAVSVLVFITILTFVTILTGAMMAATTLTKSQLESDIRLQEIYGKDVERVDEIYQELTNIDNQVPMCKIDTQILNNTNAKYTFNFNKEVIGFNIEKINVYNGKLLNTNIGRSFTLSSSLPAVSTRLESNKKYIVSFDYKCMSGNNNFVFGLYLDDKETNQIKNLDVIVEEQHMEYIIETLNDVIDLKFKADVKESNNITITNLKIIEVGKEAQKGNFVEFDKKTYSLVTFLEENLEQFVVLNKNSFVDENNNGNEYSLKILE